MVCPLLLPSVSTDASGPDGRMVGGVHKEVNMLFANLSAGFRTLLSCIKYGPVVVLAAMGMHVAGVPEGVLSLTPVAYVLWCVAAVASSTSRAGRYNRLDRRHNLRHA